MSITSAFHLKEGEKVQRVVRRTPLMSVVPACLSFVCIGAPFFFMIPLLAHRIVGPIVFGASFLTGVILAARAYMTWYWNAFVITDRRIIDIDQRGFFERIVSEAPFEKIQDVSYAVRGIIGTLFNFGTIVVQTAGASTNLELPHVRTPRDVHHLITELVSSRSAAFQPSTRSQKVSSLLDAAAQLNDAEARAFLTTLQQAVAERIEPED